MSAAIAPLATKAELQAAIAPLATKAETEATTLSLKTELRSDIREEGDRTRRHFDVVAERLREDIRLIAEGHVALDQRVDPVEADLRGDIAGLDRRVTRLESSRTTNRRRR